MNNKKENKISFSIFVGVATFGISLCISFFVTPIIVDKLGSEAYGFVSLANNFVSYAALITVALAPSPKIVRLLLSRSCIYLE